jgi:hypothetical protein
VVAAAVGVRLEPDGPGAHDEDEDVGVGAGGDVDVVGDEVGRAPDPGARVGTGGAAVRADGA